MPSDLDDIFRRHTMSMEGILERGGVQTKHDVARIKMCIEELNEYMKIGKPTWRQRRAIKKGLAFLNETLGYCLVNGIGVENGV